MKRVTDPNILKQLNAQDGGNNDAPVTDPELLRQLEPKTPKALTAGRAIGLGTRGSIAGLASLPMIVGNAANTAVNYGIHGINKEFGSNISDIPMASESLQGLLTQAGLPQAQTDEEKFIQAVNSGAASAMSSAGAAKAVGGLLAPLGENFGLQALSGSMAGGSAEIARQKGADPVGQLLAGVAGGTLPSLSALPAMAIRGLMRRGAEGAKTMVHNIALFNRAGIEPSVGLAAGRRSLQGLENLSANAPGGAPVSVMYENANANAGRMLTQSADRLSPRYGAEAAGRAIHGGIKNFVDTFKQRANGLFRAVDSHIPENTPVQVSNTQSVLNRMATPIQGAESVSGVLRNPTIAKVAQAFKKDAANGTLPYVALSKLRSMVGEKLSSSDLVSDIPRGALKKLYGGLSEDMKSAAQTAGPRALYAFRRANKFYKAGMDRIENTLQKLADKNIPEKVFDASLQGKGGATVIRQVRNSVSPDDWDIVVSTNVRRLGRATAGNQNAAGDKFSLSTFLTNWNKMSPQTRSAMFGGTRYSGMQKDLDAIAKAAEKVKEASTVLKNPSGTARQNLWYGSGGAIAASLATGHPAPAALMVGLAGMNHAAARLMTSPRFVRWLARSTAVTSKDVATQVASLEAMAARSTDPQFRDDVAAYVKNLKKPENNGQEGSSPPLQ